MLTVVPAGMGQPAISVSTVALRANESSGASHRSPSSTALGMSERSRYSASS
jgi:hypothetical protein